MLLSSELRPNVSSLLLPLLDHSLWLGVKRVLNPRIQPQSSRSWFLSWMEVDLLYVRWLTILFHCLPHIARPSLLLPPILIMKQRVLPLGRLVEPDDQQLLLFIHVVFIWRLVFFWVIIESIHFSQQVVQALPSSRRIVLPLLFGVLAIFTILLLLVVLLLKVRPHVWVVVLIANFNFLDLQQFVWRRSEGPFSKLFLFLVVFLVVFLEVFLEVFLVVFFVVLFIFFSLPRLSSSLLLRDVQLWDYVDIRLAIFFSLDSWDRPPCFDVIAVVMPRIIWLNPNRRSSWHVRRNLERSIQVDRGWVVETCVDWRVICKIAVELLQLGELGLVLSVQSGEVSCLLA